jgi:hypothetical protein
MNIHRGQVRPGAASRVLVLNTSELAWTGWQGRMLSSAWMLVFSSAESTNSSSRRGRFSQCLAYRSRMRPAFEINCGSRGKNPGAMLPRANRIFVQPPPNGLVA